jgi:hypothetical protein
MQAALDQAKRVVVAGAVAAVVLMGAAVRRHR